MHLIAQAVAPESRLAASPIAQAGTATAGVGVLQLLAGLDDQASATGTALATAQGTVASAQGLTGTVHGVVSTVSESFGLPPFVLLAAVLIACGAAVIYWRQRQREEGFA